MLQVTSDDIKDMVFQSKAVAQATFVTNGRDHEIFPFSYLRTTNLADILEERLFDEANEQHLIHT